MENISLEKAKEWFFTYNCSRFVMGREDHQKYQLYASLNIDKALENEWREEQLTLLYKNIEKHNNKQKTCITFNQMYDLFENINNDKSLTIMIMVLERGVDTLEEKDKIVIAETIIGRKVRRCRSGLIFMAYDLGAVDKASLFAQYALELLEGVFEDIKLKKRAESAKKECAEIMKELSLD